MAKKLNVKKGDILNPHGDNMAVRLALAETHIINDTKEYLKSVFYKIEFILYSKVFHWTHSSLKSKKVKLSFW